MFSPGPVRPPAPSVPQGPQLHVAPNPYLGIPAHSTPINPSGVGRPNYTPAPGPTSPTNQINPLYYNQLGNLPGDTISESTGKLNVKLIISAMF